MSFKKLALGLAAATALTTFAGTAAQAQEGIYVPLLTYRTGAFAGSGVHIADGMADYPGPLAGVLAALVSPGGRLALPKPRHSPAR